MAAFEATFFLALIPLLSAFGLGIVHAFEVDHMTAVGAFVARRPRPMQAIKFGVKWAAGHALSLLVFGSLVFALKLAIADDVNHWLERLVGLALFGVGVYSLIKMRAHGVTHTHPHGTGSFWMGMLHGVAGTAAFIGESIVVLSGTAAAATAQSVASHYVAIVSYTVAFSVGVLAAMAVYAFALGGVLSWTSARSQTLSIGARAVAGLWSCAIGLFWMLR